MISEDEDKFRIGNVIQNSISKTCDEMFKFAFNIAMKLTTNLPAQSVLIVKNLYLKLLPVHTVEETVRRFTK